MLVPAKNDWRIDMPAAPKGAKWTEAPRIVQKLNYRADRQGFIEDGNTHIFVLSADNGGTPRQITSGAFNHGAPRWMPDGKSIVFSGLRMDERRVPVARVRHLPHRRRDGRRPAAHDAQGPRRQPDAVARWQVDRLHGLRLHQRHVDGREALRS